MTFFKHFIILYRDTLSNSRVCTRYNGKNLYEIIMRLGFTCYLPSATLNAPKKDNRGKTET